MKHEFTAEETRAIIAVAKAHDDSHQVDRLGDYGLICTECTVRLYEIAAAATTAAFDRFIAHAADCTGTWLTNPTRYVGCVCGLSKLLAANGMAER